MFQHADHFSLERTKMGGDVGGDRGRWVEEGGAGSTDESLVRSSLIRAGSHYGLVWLRFTDYPAGLKCGGFSVRGYWRHPPAMPVEIMLYMKVRKI